MKIISKILAVALLISACTVISGCKAKEKVVIFSSAETFRNEHLEQRLTEQFPDIDIVIDAMPSGTQASKLLAEGKDIEADICFDLEYGHVPKIAGSLADLSGYDYSVYTEDMIPAGDAKNKVLPVYKNGGCIALNPKVLSEKQLAEPTSYQDLLDPKYKGLISMPNPSSSGTGYMFLKSLVNVMGEDAAFDYFDKLSVNILQFTSSGAGPVNALVGGEVAIGLAMTAQAVTEINGGAELKIMFFEEGSPTSLYGMAMVEGKQENAAVKKVFDFINSTLIAEDKELFVPEKIYKDKDFTIKNYPSGIKYADMSNNTAEEKTRLLEKWKH